MNPLEGVLPVHKPAGWTSHDVVAKLRRILRTKRIGHAGTLDPDVTGVLPLALGRATRIIEYLQEMPKAYIAEMTIGFATDTEDVSGKVIEKSDRVVLDRASIEQTLASFIGTLEQVPPMYSAVKVDGRRLYDLARQGVQVERKARKVTVHELQLEQLELEAEYPKLTIRVECSKGTYIRTLCKDIGQALGYPAVMSGLVRTMSCGIPLSRCLDIGTIAELYEAGSLSEHILPAGDALQHIPHLELQEQSAARLLQGQKLKLEQVAPDDPSGLEHRDIVRVFAPGRQFIGICGIKNGLLIPQKMFH